MKNLIVLLVFGMLVGCMSLEERRKKEADRHKQEVERIRSYAAENCSGYGFKSPSTEYSNCMMTESRRIRDKEERMQKQQAAEWQRTQDRMAKERAEKKRRSDERYDEAIKGLGKPSSTTDCYTLGNTMHCDHK